MSLDIYLTVPEKCPHCGGALSLETTEVFSKNITHNVAPMWRKAGVYEALYESEGKLAKEFVELLDRGVEHMRANYSEYEKLNSANGWGLAKNALPWLEQVRDAFRANPYATIHVSR
jgi:hypothetical protein